MNATAAPPEISLPSVSFFGRTLAEYAQFFTLDFVALRGRAVLDVGAGPSSFTAEACRRGIDAVALDPLYGCGAAALATHVQLDYERMFTEMRSKPHLFRFNHADQGTEAIGFPSFDAAERDRRLAAQRFLADYTAHLVRGRYVSARLPRLPFFDGSFDLVLCAHLLFVYGRQFDLTWHVAACQELARVSADEVRIHPVCGADGRPYPGLDRLRRELRRTGIASELMRVNYEFFVGGDSMLVLRKASS